MSDERREHHFTLHLASGIIVEGDPQDLSDVVEDIPDEEWRELGSIDVATGRPHIDWTRASRWRPLSEFWRWR